MHKSLKIIKGFDKNKIPFSAFVLCTKDDNDIIINNMNSLDMSKMHIIYKQIGHDVNQKIYDDVITYINLKYTK